MAGGAGATNSVNYSDGGQAGGYIGGDGNTNAATDTKNENRYGTGATQTAGGSALDTGNSSSEEIATGSFGKGADSTLSNTSYGSGGGGAGLYGGGASTLAGAGGGSGYIGNSLLITYNEYTKHMTGYNVTTSTDSSTRTNSTTNVSEEPKADYAKLGNGYAKITFISE